MLKQDINHINILSSRLVLRTIREANIIFQQNLLTRSVVNNLNIKMEPYISLYIFGKLFLIKSFIHCLQTSNICYNW